MANAKERLSTAIDLSDLTCGCLSIELQIIMQRGCPCRDACKGKGNAHVKEPGPQDPNCPCDPHCGMCMGECTPQDEYPHRGNHCPPGCDLSRNYGRRA